MVEYDRWRSVKEQLLYAAIATCLDASVAVSTLEVSWEAAVPSRNPALGSFAPGLGCPGD